MSTIDIQYNNLYCGNCMDIMGLFRNDYVNIYYTDTPYNLGSTYKIDKEGHYVFTKSEDFMKQWEAMDGRWWDKYFAEVYRTLKPGGFFITHNIDRQSDLWTYYARRNNLLPMQKLYWLFIDNFPKGVDVTKHIDKLLGQKRVKVGKSQTRAQKISTGVFGSWGQHADETGKFDLTIPTSTTAQKYDGYIYGNAALKQTIEEILVFNKPLPKGVTVPKAIIKNENLLSNKISKLETLPYHPSVLNLNKTKVKNPEGDKWTPQLLLYEEVVPMLLANPRINHIEAAKITQSFPQIKYNEEELIPFLYEPKISKNERDSGLENFEDTTLSDGRKKWNMIANTGRKRKNPHPSPKPQRLVKWVLDLFKPPDNILVVDTFMGSGAIPQACKELGINYIGIELNEQFFKVAEAKVNNIKDTLF